MNVAKFPVRAATGCGSRRVGRSGAAQLVVVERSIDGIWSGARRPVCAQYTAIVVEQSDRAALITFQAAIKIFKIREFNRHCDNAGKTAIGIVQATGNRYYDMSVRKSANRVTDMCGAPVIGTVKHKVFAFEVLGFTCNTRRHGGDQFETRFINGNDIIEHWQVRQLRA